jgi:hypothetical protein
MSKTCSPGSNFILELIIIHVGIYSDLMDNLLLLIKKKKETSVAWTTDTSNTIWQSFWV